MSPEEILVASFLGGWLLLSILNQFRFSWLDRVKRADAFALLPLWTFFAPNPGQSDYHCVYRDQFPDGTLGEWKELPLTEPRKPYSFFWNPEKRSKKVLSDVVASLVTDVASQRLGHPDVMVTVPYLLLLNVVSAQPGSGGALRQFAVVETYGFIPTGAPRALLSSIFHSVARKEAAA